MALLINAFSMTVVCTCVFAQSAAAQTIGEAIGASAAGSRGAAGQKGVQIDIPEVQLELKLRKGDLLIYDVTSEYLTEFQGGGGSSINRYSGVLTLTVDEERKDGYVLSWPDVELGDRNDLLEPGQVFISKTGRLELPSGHVSEVMTRFLRAMTLPPNGTPPRKEFQVTFRAGSVVTARALGKVYLLDSKQHQASIALYGRTGHSTQDWEFHTVFDWALGVVVRSTCLDLERGVRSYMEFKSLRHSPAPPRGRVTDRLRRHPHSQEAEGKPLRKRLEWARHLDVRVSVLGDDGPAEDVEPRAAAAGGAA